MKEKTVIDWIKERKDIFNLTGIEKIAGLPSGSLRRAVSGRDPFPKKHEKTLFNYLNKHSEEWQQFQDGK